MMKQWFYVFACQRFYPEGGMHDYIGKAETYVEALLMVADLEGIDFWEIATVDEDGELVRLAEGMRE